VQQPSASKRDPDGIEAAAYTLIRSRKRRKTLTLLVRCDGSVVVRAPAWTAKGEVEAFVRRKAEWIERKRGEMIREQDVPRKSFREGERFPYLGKSYPLSVRGSSGRASLEFGDGFFLMTPLPEERARALFVGWYRRMARRRLGPRIQFFSGVLGLPCPPFRITDAAARWGSCSPSNRLAFSWRLILAPPEAIDYVVVHELAHMREKSHAPAFWDVVASASPDYREQRAWLRRHGATLTL
jgi:predicted metal-dependent hydrolase